MVPTESEREPKLVEKNRKKERKMWYNFYETTKRVRERDKVT